MNTTPTTDPQEIVRSSIEQLLAAMTEHPQDLNVRLIPSSRRPTLVVTCHRVDYGAILGKHGTMLNSIKLIAAHMGMRHGLKATLILDEDGCVGTPAPRRRFAPNPEWDSEPFLKLATLFCSEVFGHCQIAIESVMTGSSKVTILTEQPIPGDVLELEKAIEAVFNCIGVVQGQRIMAEIVMP